jgi:putative peptide zinc metalloprotease protein
MTPSSPRRQLIAAAKEAPKAIAAKHGARSDRPALASDLVTRRQVQMGEVRWFVKNLQTLKYYIFFDSEWRLIELFDGTRTREEIVQEYNALYPSDPIDIPLVLEYEEMLRKMDLIDRSVAERHLALFAGLRTARQRAAEEKAEGFNPFFLLFHVLDPNRFLDRTVRYVRWVWTPPIVAIWSVAVLWTIGVFALHWEPIFTGTYELYAFLRKPLLDAIQFFFILSFLGFFHEYGHAYATKIYGGDVHDIGIALLYFTPAFYCDTTDALLFQNKWHRLWVNTAGIYVEGFVCAGATALWVASYPDTLLHEIAYKTMLFTGISTIFFNINPLIKIDGYHALTSLLEMPDLREESFRHIGSVFQKYVLRLPVEVLAVSKRRRRIYWTYGTLALAYIGFIMAFITRVFFNFYHKLFPDFAVLLLIATVLKIFQKRVRLVTRTARLFYLDKKEFVMSRQTRVQLAIAALLLLILFLYPWGGRTIRSEAVLRPVNVARIEAPEDGVVTRVAARESAVIEAGSELFRLRNAESETDRVHFVALQNVFLRSAARARDQAVAENVFKSERRVSAASTALQGEHARIERLVLRSPISGRVLTARVEDRALEFVRRGTVLAEVGQCNRLVADLPVSERLIGHIRVGTSVRALLRQRPLRPLHGRVEAIAPASENQPVSASGLAEPLAPSSNPERFVVRAVFDNRNGELRPGETIQAKIDCGRESLAHRAGQILWRWLKAVFW